MKTRIAKTNGESNVSALFLPSRSEYCITVRGKDDATMNNILLNTSKESKAAILSSFVFAGSKLRGKNRKPLSAPDSSAILLHGDTHGDEDISSMQAFAVSGIKPLPVEIRKCKIGFVFEDEHARYCRLNGVSPENPNASRTEQTREVFEIMASALTRYGFCFTDTVRTWFYLDRILDWYKEFNSVRTAFFEETGVFGKMVPASTGIGSGNASGTALTAGLIAVQPKSNKVKIQPIPSPMQGSALNYKSSFSRAVEISFPTHRSLFISGTASIDKEGKSVFIDDPARQISLTMRVVEALLHSRGMNWNDLFRGIVYFRNIEDQKLFDQYCSDCKIPLFSLASAHADICRNDLLFEIEADAIKIDSMD